jgi:hypothetical protein
VVRCTQAKKKAVPNRTAVLNLNLIFGWSLADSNRRPLACQAKINCFAACRSVSPEVGFRRRGSAHVALVRRNCGRNCGTRRDRFADGLNAAPGCCSIPQQRQASTKSDAASPPVARCQLKVGHADARLFNGMHFLAAAAASQRSAGSSGSAMGQSIVARPRAETRPAARRRVMHLVK